MEPYEAYQCFLAIKAHFTRPSYDYKKYNGKVNAKFDAFSKAKGKYFYGKLGKKFKKQLPEYFATLFAYLGNVTWVGDCDTEEAEEAWTEHQKNMQSIKKTFEKDVNKIIEIAGKNDLTFKEMFTSNGSDLPAIEKLRKQELITIETCVILNRLTGYTTKIKCNNPLWENIKTTIIKFDTFLALPPLGTFANILKTKL